jgi:anti-sigma regulatory factor (Ser/Thr protein kinase)
MGVVRAASHASNKGSKEEVEAEFALQEALVNAIRHGWKND